MTGISSGAGFFSGIDTTSLIDQLIQAEARPRTQMQARVAQLQLKNAAYLDLNSRLQAVKTASAGFRLNKTFDTKGVTTSNADVATATASNTAAAGAYTFIVDRLVSTQQLLSRGFADKDVSGLGMTKLTLEGAQARLDRDVSLSDLNDGSGVQRGKITITDSSGAHTDVDLSRSATVGEVLDAINNNGTARVTASVKNGHLVLKDTAGGGGTMTVANATGSTTATSLGIAGSATAGTLTGAEVYGLSNNTSLASLNDGRGVSYVESTTDTAFNFSIKITDGADVKTARVNIGKKLDPTDNTKVLAGPATTVGQVMDRINEALTSAGVTQVAAQVDKTNGRLRIVDSRGGTTRTIEVTEATDSTAQDLGLATSVPATGAVDGRRVLAGLNTTLASGINGGQGIGGDGQLFFQARDGTGFAVTVDTNGTINDVIDTVNAASGGKIKLSLNANGTGLDVTDTTGGTGNLQIGGSASYNSAESLGIATSGSGAASNVVRGTNLQRQYISSATTLASLNNGKGVGTGTFKITDSQGIAASVVVGTDVRTVGDLLRKINTRGLAVTARINDNGDGIEIDENTGGSPAGANKIKIEETSGSVAKSLNLLGEASGVGASNKINGSFERTIAVGAGDTLQQVADKINNAGAGVSASIIQDGGGATPFRLNLTGSSSGQGGRFLVETGGTDLSLTALDKGQDARVFFGSSDPARAVLSTSSTNSVDGLVQGLKVDLKSASATPVTLTVTTDTGAIESAVGTFVKTLNTLLDRIDFQSSYNADANKGSPLLGDSTTQSLKSAVYAAINGRNKGFTGRYGSLADVGITIGSGGNVELNSDKLRTALTTDPDAVEALFTSRDVTTNTTREISPGVTVRDPNATTTFNKLGVVGQIEELASRYITAAGGVLTNQSNSINDQVKNLNTRILDFTDRLQRRRDQLTAQFQAMESAIGKLKTQQGALGSIGVR